MEMIYLFFEHLLSLIDNVKKRLFFIKATIIIYSIISLGSPLIEWDARGIWLFHAKRIFFDENVYYDELWLMMMMIDDDE